MAEYCEKCGKELTRLARCEFHCDSCDETYFFWGYNYSEGNPYEYDVDETNWRDAEDGELDMEAVKRRKRW